GVTLHVALPAITVHPTAAVASGIGTYGTLCACIPAAFGGKHSRARLSCVRRGDAIYGCTYCLIGSDSYARHCKSQAWHLASKKEISVRGHAARLGMAARILHHDGAGERRAGCRA
uniref:Transposon n=1 Tax=Chlamydomonas reinhardtii TaxID=3055 RepID=Q99200_CHLRE|nr:unnamed protein product [Chlamydomonas reinhardtii]